MLDKRDMPREGGYAVHAGTCGCDVCCLFFPERAPSERLLKIWSPICVGDLFEAFDAGEAD